MPKSERDDSTSEPGRAFIVSGWHGALDPQNIWTMFIRLYLAHRLLVQHIYPDITRHGYLFVTIVFSTVDSYKMAFQVLRNWPSAPRLSDNSNNLQIEWPSGYLEARRATSAKRTRGSEYPTREERGRLRYR